MDWIGTVLTAVGTSIITCAVMEAYFVRRAKDEVGEYDREDVH
jgi:hypothetical protein